MKRIIDMLAASVLASAALMGSTAQAQTVANPLDFAFGIGYGRGGDIIAEPEYTDGSITNIKAGNGLEVYAGGAYRLNEKFALQADIGYQSSTGDATNGELTFKRIPIELLGFYYLTNNLRVGAGARFDEHVKLSGTGVASPVQADFDSAVGAMLELEYLFTPQFGIKLRGVKENFSVSGYPVTFNGNQAAILLTFYY